MPVVVNLPVTSHFPQIKILVSFTRNLHLSSFLSPRHLYLHLREIKSISICCFSGVAMPTSSKTVVEYAKSNRSSCKKCFKTIDKNAVRLGLVNRDSRGFDMTSWHHMNCFPFESDSMSSTEAIKGFSLLQSSDQESLKGLLGSRKKTLEEIQERNEDEENEMEKYPKKRKIQERDDGAENEAKEGNAAKAQLALPEEENEVEITLSVSAIKDNYKDAKLSPKWKAFETIIFLERDEGLHDSSKIAAFDFDGCLVNTSVKRVGPDAWSLLYPSIPEKLRKLYDEGYKLVIFTNESNIERWKKKRQVAVDSKLGRLNGFIKLVNVPIQVFIACGVGKPTSGLAEDPYRKPKTGMWNVMAKYLNSGISIDMDKSFYVGDAAGRINDHSDADIKFAQAIGLKFHLPEEYFQE